MKRNEMKWEEPFIKGEWEGTEISGFSERTSQAVASQSEGCSRGPKALEKHLKEIEPSVGVELLQKAA